MRDGNLDALAAVMNGFEKKKGSINFDTNDQVLKFSSINYYLNLRYYVIFIRDFDFSNGILME